MTKHSRNNTASSVFTYAERGKLGAYYGTKKQRLGTESMREFDSCSLCLQRARDPVSCSRGHLYCKECVYSDLLSQRKEIKRYQAKIEAMAAEEEEERETAILKARERVISDFEKNQLGLGGKRTDLKPPEGVGKSESSVEAFRGSKRKFSIFDQETVDKLAKEAEAAALRQIEAEQVEARRAKLPDFWLPSLTPEAAPGRLKDIKLQCLCHQSKPSHLMNMKSLIPVIFSYDVKSSSNKSSDAPGPVSHASSKNPEHTKAICPSCKKELTNATKLTLLRPCSHVICKTCCDSLVKPSSQCSACDAALDESKKDIIEIEGEGTGFSGGGLAETIRVGVAFQG
ncbi:uncharacterized protein EI90DRAFT_904478 [Cantharellus anzutake]|uniref:uncharacterized protein n=1 Tax=Cantharellus anzutake TaxID=1750568 RepID=UPI0019033CC6|nr:uncharacterized protein EI90DRAFT_904478 [Cantharellus anzutake]KAF8331946.1 hypothetical protein EI90DRAFT_904478 [Cantharellus anzutake]